MVNHFVLMWRSELQSVDFTEIHCSCFNLWSGEKLIRWIKTLLVTQNRERVLAQRYINEIMLHSLIIIHVHQRENGKRCRRIFSSVRWKSINYRKMFDHLKCNWNLTDVMHSSQKRVKKEQKMNFFFEEKTTRSSEDDSRVPSQW
jgi:hypothetical protein